MTSSDVDDIARLINQLHKDQPGVIRPERVRQGWRAFVARNDEGGAVGFLLGPFIDYGLAHESAGTLNSAGGDADSVRELSVTATGRCSANDRSAAAATRAVIRPSSR